AFEGEIMSLPWGRGLALACTRTFPNDLYFAGPYADPYLGGVGCRIKLTARPAPHALRCERPAVPGIMAEDAVGLGDDVPPLNVVKVSSVGVARLDVLCLKLRS